MTEERKEKQESDSGEQEPGAGGPESAAEKEEVPGAPESGGKKVDEEWKAQVAREKERLGSREAGRPKEEERALPPASFVSFISSLAAQTLIQLGEVENPLTGKRRIDLPGAQYSIDLLTVLRDKTKGNLSQEEERQLDGALFDLRMRFVQASQCPPEQSGREKAEAEPREGG